jgi:hypothetical protein
MGPFVIAFLLTIRQDEFRPGQPLPKSPDDVAYEAAKYLERILTIDKSLTRSLRTRFISLYSLPKKATRKTKTGDVEFSPLDDMVKVLLFAINQTNRVNAPATLIRVSDDLFAIELDSPGWTPEAWESLAAKDPYFRPEWIEEATWSWLTSYSQSAYPIMRADQFVTLATTAPHYYELLGLPKTKDELLKLLGVDETLLATSNRIKASVKTDGLTVTRNNRILERRQGAFDIWSSNDVANSKDKKNALTQLDTIGGEVHKLEIDAQEHFFELGNGLWGTYLNDAKGVRADEVPINLASDPNFIDNRVIAGRSCFVCHVLGIQGIASDQASLLRNQVIQLRTLKPEDAIALESRYDDRMVQRFIATDQENFRAAVEHITGTTPEKIATMYGNAWRDYAESRVSLHQAAVESGLSDAGLVSVITPAIDPNLLKFLELDAQGKPKTLARDVFENKFSIIQLLKGKPQKKGRKPMPMVKHQEKKAA